MGLRHAEPSSGLQQCPLCAASLSRDAKADASGGYGRAATARLLRFRGQGVPAAAAVHPDIGGVAKSQSGHCMCGRPVRFYQMSKL